MDNQNQDHKEELVITPEEKQAEEEALKGVNDEELRDKLADEMGLDPDIDAELLDKLVTREKSHQEKLSGAIKQKITWRDKAKGSQAKPDNAGTGKTQENGQKPLTVEEIDQLFNARMEARDLSELDLPDELKDEVKDLAKLKGISVRQAAQLPYIQSRRQEVEKQKLIENATPKRKGRGGYVTSYDPSKPLNAADYDLSTEDGRKAWNDAKAAKRKYEAEHNK